MITLIISFFTGSNNFFADCRCLLLISVIGRVARREEIRGVFIVDAGFRILLNWLDSNYSSLSSFIFRLFYSYIPFQLKESKMSTLEWSESEYEIESVVESFALKNMNEGSSFEIPKCIPCLSCTLFINSTQYTNSNISI